MSCRSQIIASEEVLPDEHSFLDVQHLEPPEQEVRSAVENKSGMQYVEPEQDSMLDAIGRLDYH